MPRRKQGPGMPTRRRLIYIMLIKRQLTCAQLCGKIIAWETPTLKITKKQKAKYKYLSGSISSILAKMVKDKELRYAKGKGPRGGHLYEIRDSKYR